MRSALEPSWLFLLPFLFVLFVVLGALAILIELRLIDYTHQRLGLDRRWAYALLASCIVGSRVDVAVTRSPGEGEIEDTAVPFSAISYIPLPLIRSGGTIVAINLGGALLPAAISSYLVIHVHLGLRALAGVTLVAAIVHRLARPERGVGIVIPTLLPAASAAAVALALGGSSTAALAYVAGTLGTLLGGDLLNLGKVSTLGTPVASIGGAGTFDAVFLTGIFAVLLAAA